MISSPPLVLTHPRLPGVQLHRGLRDGEVFLLAAGVQMTGDQLVDVGEWLAEQGRLVRADSS
jgi:hypothetical protein